MKRHSIEARGVFYPDQLSTLASLHAETLALLATEGPYTGVDREAISLTVARVLVDNAQQGATDPAVIE